MRLTLSSILAVVALAGVLQLCGLLAPVSNSMSDMRFRLRGFLRLPFLHNPPRLSPYGRGR